MNKTDLLTALTIVKPGLSNKEVLEQTTSFAFLKNRVVTYNDEISISHPVEGINFEGAIKAEELYGLLTRLNKDEIELGLDGNQVRIKCGRLKAGLTLEEEVQLPLKELPKKWKELKTAGQFKSFMKLAMQTCSSDMTKLKLTCVYVRQDGVIMGADGYRLVYCQGSKIPVDNFLIPATSITELLKINPTHIQLSKSWIHFKNEQGTAFSCRRVIEKYVPDKEIERILKVEEIEQIKFPNKIEDMLDRGKQFAKRSFVFDEIVEIEIDKGEILMKAKSDETKSWVKETTSIKSKATIMFKITPALFEDILKMTRTCVLDKGGEKVKFIMQGMDGGDCEYLVMLAK